jgi:hypothetical protein
MVLLLRREAFSIEIICLVLSFYSFSLMYISHGWCLLGGYLSMIVVACEGNRMQKKKNFFYVYLNYYRDKLLFSHSSLDKYLNHYYSGQLYMKLSLDRSCIKMLFNRPVARQQSYITNFLWLIMPCFIDQIYLCFLRVF